MIHIKIHEVRFCFYRGNRFYNSTTHGNPVPGDVVVETVSGDGSKKKIIARTLFLNSDNEAARQARLSGTVVRHSTQILRELHIQM